jgi:NADH:ubiquinone oxidoreductase subunit H
MKLNWKRFYGNQCTMYIVKFVHIAYFFANGSFTVHFAYESSNMDSGYWLFVKKASIFTQHIWIDLVVRKTIKITNLLSVNWDGLLKASFIQNLKISYLICEFNN